MSEQVLESAWEKAVAVAPYHSALDKLTDCVWDVCHELTRTLFGEVDADARNMFCNLLWAARCKMASKERETLDRLLLDGWEGSVEELFTAARDLS